MATSIEFICGYAVSQIRPSIVSYNAAISACEKGSEWQHASSLFFAMLAASIRPSTISLNAAMTACERCSAGSRPWSCLMAMASGPIWSAAMQPSTAASKACNGLEFPRCLRRWPKWHLSHSVLSGLSQDTIEATRSESTELRTTFPIYKWDNPDNPTKRGLPMATCPVFSSGTIVSVMAWKVGLLFLGSVIGM